MSMSGKSAIVTLDRGAIEASPQRVEGLAGDAGFSSRGGPGRLSAEI